MNKNNSLQMDFYTFMVTTQGHETKGWHLFRNYFTPLCISQNHIVQCDIYFGQFSKTVLQFTHTHTKIFLHDNKSFLKKAHKILLYTELFEQKPELKNRFPIDLKSLKSIHANLNQKNMYSPSQKIIVQQKRSNYG